MWILIYVFGLYVVVVDVGDDVGEVVGVVVVCGVGGVEFLC